MSVEELTRENYFNEATTVKWRKYLLKTIDDVWLDVETTDNPLYMGDKWLKCRTTDGKRHYINKDHIIVIREI